MSEKDLIVLFDGTEKEIEDNSSLDNITIIFDTREELDSFFAKLSMEENTKYVEFKKKTSNEAYAKYENLVLISKDKTITEIVKEETVDDTETEVSENTQTSNSESVAEDTATVVENETTTEVTDSSTDEKAMKTVTTYIYKLLFGLRKKTDLEIRMDHAEDAIKLLIANALM